jgi:hypothetical protein
VQRRVPCRERVQFAVRTRMETCGLMQWPGASACDLGKSTSLWGVDHQGDSRIASRPSFAWLGNLRSECGFGDTYAINRP